jgi:hypothetical protein
VADTRKLRSFAASREMPINYYEYADMVHDWMLLNLPESKMAQQQIMDILKTLLIFLK